MALITNGTGRATCRICYKKILKNQKQILFSGYRFRQCVHSDYRDCSKDRVNDINSTISIKNGRN